MPRTNEISPWSRPSSSLFPFTNLQEDMNRLFDQFYNGSRPSLTDWNSGVFSAPSVNVIEDNKSFKVEAELAGIDPKNVQVEVTKDGLTLKGERRQEEKQEGKNYLRHEISYGAFNRMIALPDTVDGDKAKATFKNGLLTIEIPKLPEAQKKSKKVEIESAG